jgi:hypothetical protein
VSPISIPRDRTSLSLSAPISNIKSLISGSGVSNDIWQGQRLQVKNRNGEKIVGVVSNIPKHFRTGEQLCPLFLFHVIELLYHFLLLYLTLNL